MEDGDDRRSGWASADLRDAMSELKDQLHEDIAALREETRLGIQELGSLIAGNTQRLDTIEPVLKNLDKLRERGWGIATALLFVLFLVSGGISSGWHFLLLKLGIEAP
jgi:hypothetical protein